MSVVRTIAAVGMAILGAAGCGSDDAPLGTETTVIDGATVYLAEAAPCDDVAACEPSFYVDDELFVERCLSGGVVAGRAKAIFAGDVYHEVAGSGGAQLIQQDRQSALGECIRRWVSLSRSPDLG